MKNDKIPFETEKKKRALFPEIFMDSPIDAVVEQPRPADDSDEDDWDGTKEYRI